MTHILALKSLSTLAVAGFALGLTTPSLAQSYDFTRTLSSSSIGAVDSEARLSFTVPFGGEEARRSTKLQPRMEFVVRHDGRGGNSFHNSGLRSHSVPAFRETRLGFTLGEQSHVLLNGTAYDFAAITDMDEAQLGTAGKIGAGVGIAALAVVAIGVIVIASGDCGLGESGGEGCGT